MEARAAGREGLGIDISSLAQFVAQVKCTVFSEMELEVLSEWSGAVGADIDIQKPSQPITEYAERGYYSHRAIRLGKLLQPAWSACAPTPEVGTQASAACPRQIVVHYLVDHPEERHHSAASIARTALSNAFHAKIKRRPPLFRSRESRPEAYGPCASI